MKKILLIIFSVCLFGCDDTDIALRYNGKDKYVFDKELVDAAAPTSIVISDNTENLPVVAVILGLEDGEYFIYKDYVDAIARAQLYPVFVSHTHPGQQLAEIKPSGILAIGGAFGDLHRVSVTPTDDEASWDDMLRAYSYQILIDYAEFHKLPFLGICAGEQELAVSLGGKLVGHLSGHKGGVTHDIKIEPDSLLFKIAGVAAAKVNSYHSSAVYPFTGGAYRVTATGPNGVIEAIEPINPWSDFVLGVQWHPEKNVSEIDGKIFQSFADSVSTHTDKGITD